MPYSRVPSSSYSCQGCLSGSRDPRTPGAGVLGRLALAWIFTWILGFLSQAHGAAVYVQLPPDLEADPRQEPGWAVANRVLVRFKPDAIRRSRELEGTPGFRWLIPRRRAGLAGGDPPSVVEQLAVIDLPPGAALIDAIRKWGNRADVLYAEPDLRVHTAVEPFRAGAASSSPASGPNDFEFTHQWSLHNTGQTGGRPGADIRAIEAWQVTTGSTNVVVAVVDTGVDYFHPDLEANVWVNPGEIPGNGLDDDGNGFIDDVHGYDFVSDDGDPMDDNVHGTHVAGIIGAVGDDENGIAGVAWSVRIMALKALDDGGGGAVDDTLRAIAYARAAGAGVINASWGTTTRSRALDDVVAEAVAGGLVFVAAAGNNGTDVRFFPAAVPDAIAVAATDANDHSPTFSNYGSFVDLVAPGDGIESTIPNGSWSMLSGTSMAAPHVSGLAALLLARRPSFTPSEIETILRSTSDEIESDRYTGAGRINAARAVRVEAPLPEARLELGATWSGRFDLRGAARGNGYAGHRIELGAGPRPKEWVRIGAASVPGVDGILIAGFDSARFDDGEYMVRLVVSNQLGQAAVLRRPVAIRNVEITSPQNNDILRQGDRVEVRGTVFGDGRAFEVTWGLGRNPERWEAAGLTPGPGGTGVVVDGVLAYWDTAVVPPAAFVTLRLVARKDDHVVGESFARMVHLEPRLRPGWPKRLPFTDEFPVDNWREFNVADLDGDGVQEIVLVDHGEPGGRPPRLMAIEPDGQPKWVRDLPAGAPEFDAPVIGDLDGDGKQEILVDTGEGGTISAFDAEGRPLGGKWPLAPGGTHFAKILADLDRDGRLEVIAVSRPPLDLVSSRVNQLIVINASGEVVRRWTLGACDEEAIIPEERAAVGNLDDNPDLEMVVVDGCIGVSAFKLSQESGPFWTAVTDVNLFAPPVVGDLEGDGHEEVIIGGVSRGQGQPGGLFVFNDRGQLRPGWPVLREESFHASPALADLNGDGRLEIIFPGWEAQNLHVIADDGFEEPGWPLPAQVNAATRSMPVIGDVDGDGAPDIVLASPGIWLQLVLAGDTARSGGIRAWRVDGTPIDFHPDAPMDGLVMESASGATWNRLPPAVLTDLDGDGQLDIVAGSIQDRAYSPTAPLITAKMRSSLYAWSLPVPAPAKDAPWTAYQGGPARAGHYLRKIPPNRPPVIPGIPNQTVAPGTPFRPVPLDLYVDDPDELRSRLQWSVSGFRSLTVTIDASRVARIESPPAWVGTESVEFKVRDSRGGEATTRVVFESRPGYRPPVAAPDAVSAVEDTPTEFDPLANDSSPTGRPLRIVAVSRSGSGVTRLLADGRVLYSPSTNSFGADHFEYTIQDDDGGSATGEVTVEVAGVNDPPRPQPDRLIIDEDTTGEFTVLSNDEDPDGDDLTLVTLASPAQGLVEKVSPDRYRFVPPPDYNGVQSFNYVVRDPAGLTATGEVAILVKPVNDAPVVRSQTVRLNRNRNADVIYDARDADGDKLSFTIVDGPTNGVLLSYPELASYQPRLGFAGGDRFTYLASDGLNSIGPTTVTLEVVAANNPPDVKSVSTVTAQSQPLPVGLDVRDVDGDEFRLRIVDTPSHGTVMLDGTNVLYTPDPAFVGDDRFAYAADDGTAEGASAEVSIRVTDVNTAPVARGEVLTVVRNVTSPILLRATDAENNPLSFLVVSNVAFGKLEGEPPRLSYTPLTNFRGIDRLQFQANDGRTTSEVATLHLLVRDPNLIPATTNQTVVVMRGQPAKFQLLATDPDGQALRAAVLKGPKSGRLFGAGIDYTYAPRGGFLGHDTFTYRVWDGLAYGPDATVTFDVRDTLGTVLEITGVRQTDLGLELTLRSEAGWRLQIEGSSDLAEWEAVGSVVNSTGTIQWVGAPDQRDRWRFFRARLDPGNGSP